uniref:SAP domain-containing protein n=1 Tax=Tetraselmis chuii TaxID=63592 RepID=A0A7S1X7R0_9CHLO|mmetsp:Transcript_40724/g.73158  ORF Transcript_40724/g.73158 Transcript_40724/m.73158 type:complete len:615 (+) Transcript_40724:302-2146(+)
MPPQGIEPVTELMVVLVACHPSMLAPSQGFEGESAHKVVMDTLVKHMKRRIIASKHDEMGVIFYGAEKQNSAVVEHEGLTPFEHTFYHQMLKPLTAKCIKDVEGLADSQSFASRVGSADNRVCGPEALKNALWACSQMFSKRTSAAKVAKKVWVFTDDDLESAQGNTSLRSGVISRVKDLSERQITVELFPIAADGGSFNMSHLWKEVLQLASDEDAEEVVHCVAGKVGELTQAVFQKAAKKRPLRSLRWTLVGDVTIAVQLFAMVAKHSKPSAHHLEARTNEAVVAESALVCQDTGMQLQSVAKKYLPVRGEKIVMDFAEFQASKNAATGAGGAGLLLLGFNSREAIKDYHQLRSAYFVYPHEKAIPGSKATFIALHAKMIAMKKVAIVRYQRAESSDPCLAALLPQWEELMEDEEGQTVQLRPPGLHLVTLPFADEIRHAEDHAQFAAVVVKADAPAVSCAESVIEELSIPDPEFSSTTIQNPALQHYYTVLHALALEEPADPTQMELRDSTMYTVEESLRMEGQSQRGCVEAMQRFKKEVFGPEGSAEQSTAAGKKRTASQALGKGEASGGPRHWTVALLRNYCIEHGLSGSGKKADLVERVENAMKETSV